MRFAVLRCEKYGHQVTVTMEEAGASFAYDAGPNPPAMSVMESLATAKHAAECGGRCTFDAPVRCPDCSSAHLDDDPDAGVVLYD